MKDGESLWIHCNTCGLETDHAICAVHRRTLGDKYFSAEYEYAIVECGGCKRSSFVRETWTSEDSPTQDEYGEWEIVPDRDIFPFRHAKRRLLNAVYKFPQDIQSVYKETLNALENNLPLLAGIGLRALLEAICVHKKAKGWGLEKKINSLVTKGILTKASADILHRVRSIGNAAAHKVTSRTIEELSLAMDVIEHLLLGVFVIPQAAKELAKSKKKRKPLSLWAINRTDTPTPPTNRTTSASTSGTTTTTTTSHSGPTPTSPPQKPSSEQTPDNPEDKTTEK